MLNIQDDPAIQEYFKRAETRPNSPLRPIESLGEKRLLTFEVAMGRASIDGKPIPPDEAKATAASIWRSQVLFIEPSVTDLLADLVDKIKASHESAGENRPLPKSLPFHTMWITGPRGIVIAGERFRAHFMTENIHEGLTYSLGFKVAANRVEVSAIGVTQHIRDALAIFLEERIVTLRKERPSRQFRKASRRLDIQDEDTINVIALRTIEPSESDGSGGNTDLKEFHSRWLVRGHLRNHWMPSRQAHELKWVDPYVKGPEAAPFKETIRHVKR